MKGVQIGLRDIYYALLTDDPATGTATYDAPVKIAGAIKAGVNPNSSLETLFYDDGPGETAATIGQISLELNVADLPLSVQAALLGHTMLGGILVRKAGDVPPWLAIGFKSLKSNGKYRFTWLVKGKFNQPEQSNETKGDKISFNTPTIQGSFVKRDCDDEWERHTDEDEADYVADLGTNWFNGPYGGAAHSTAPTVTIVPLDEAPAVAVGSPVVWTFSEALAASTVNAANFMLVKDADGSDVAGVLTLDSTRKIVTFTPTANLTAATKYRAIATKGVKCAYGIALAAPSITEFTTA